MSWLINATQLDKFRKSQKSLIILDATLHVPGNAEGAKEEFLTKHILGAQYFDITAFADPNSELPNMLIQDEKIINEKLSALGIRNDYKIIFYDNSKLHSSCRALWMMKMFGHNPHQLYILDGGLSAWEKYKGKTETGPSTVTPKKYTAKFQTEHLRTLAQIKENLHRPREQIIDVRHPVRFAGGPESRPGLRSGHIPGSISVPFTTLFDPNGNFLALEKIRTELTSVAVDIQSPIITTCGSGLTAPILDFVLDIMGHKTHAVYDGSWSEWGAEKLYPGENDLSERPVETCIEFDEPSKID